MWKTGTSLANIDRALGEASVLVCKCTDSSPVESKADYGILAATCGEVAVC